MKPRRIFRIIFGLAALVSLLVCIVTVTLWAYSYFKVDGIDLYFRFHRVSLRQSHGKVGVTIDKYKEIPVRPGRSIVRNSPLPEFRQPKHVFLGFGFGTTAQDLADQISRVTYYRLQINQLRRSAGITIDPVIKAQLERITRTLQELPEIQARAQVPHWIIVILSAPIPMLWLHRLTRQRRRMRQGLCLGCGYDLRASKERCPECGMAVPTWRPGVPQSPMSAH